MNEEKVEGLERVAPPGYRFKSRKRGSCGGTSPLPEGKTYIGGCGNHARLRNLKRSWKAFEKAAKKDKVLHVVREDLLDAIADTVAPGDDDLACQIVVHAATVQARDTGKSIGDLIDRAIAEIKATPKVAKSWTNAPTT